MSLADRLGFAGLLVAVVGVGLVYLWPDRRWIGWLCIGIAALLATYWATLEVRQKLGNSLASLWLSIAAGAIFGAIAAALIWQSKSPERTPIAEVKPKDEAKPITALDSSAKQAYQRFVAEKTRRISSYSEGSFLQMKFAAMLGQNKVPHLSENPGLNAELQETNAQYEEWVRRNAKAEEDFEAAIAALRVSWPSNPDMVRLIENARKPYRVHITEAAPLEMEAEKVWVQQTSAQLNREFIKAVKEPLEQLERYLDDQLELTR